MANGKPRPMKDCPACAGTTKCKNCGGDGVKWSFQGHSKCGPCNGTGKCPRCRGKGVVPQD